MIDMYLMCSKSVGHDYMHNAASMPQEVDQLQLLSHQKCRHRTQVSTLTPNS